MQKIIVAIIVFTLLSVPHKVHAENKYNISDRLYNYYTGILLGEGGEINKDMKELACTVKNRLDKGWSPYKVMNQYYGKYRTPTKEQVNYVKNIIENASIEECSGLYFFVAIWYAELYINPNVRPLLVLEGHKFYGYNQYSEMYLKGK